MEADLLDAVQEYITLISPLPVYYQNIPATPADEHIRLSTLPTSPQKISLCGSGSRHTWIVQCSIYVRDGVGAMAAARYADQLRDNIPYRTQLPGEFVSSTDGECIPFLRDDAWFVMPVQFRFQKIK